MSRLSASTARWRGRSILHVVDNGDGTLTITVMSPGVSKWYGPDGEQLFMSAGILVVELVIDHGGTPTDPSDDQELDFSVVREAGRNDLAGRDFCEDLALFTSTTT